jgi:hypothetical protein
MFSRRRAGRLRLLFVLALFSSCSDRESPGPETAAAPRLKKVSYTQNDFQEFTYNADGQLAKYRSQWNFVEGDDGQLKNFIVALHYDSGKKLKGHYRSARRRAGKYVYEGNVLKKTEESTTKGGCSLRTTMRSAATTGSLR